MQKNLDQLFTSLSTSSPSFSFFLFLLLLENRRRAMEKVGPRFSSPPRAPPAKACRRRNRGAGRLGEERNRKDWIRDEKRFERNVPPTAPAPRSAPTHFFSLASISLGSFCARNIRSNGTRTDRSIRSVYAYITISSFNRKLFFLFFFF